MEPWVRSRIQQLGAPDVPIADEELTVVEAERAGEPESAPVRRTRNRAAFVLAFRGVVALLELGAAREHLALLRRPRADLAAARTAREVRVRLVLGHELHHP